jgi:hypothetical protein
MPGCFDAVFVKNEHEITFFQITRAKLTRTYNLRFPADFTTSVYGTGPHVVNLRVIIPDYNNQTFKVSKSDFTNVQNMTDIDVRWTTGITQALDEQEEDMNKNDDAPHEKNGKNVPQSRDENGRHEDDQDNSLPFKILFDLSDVDDSNF